MRIMSYIKETVSGIVCVLLLILVTDLFLFVSTPIDSTKEDIIYLNILMISFGLLIWSIGYIRFGTKYFKVREALDKHENIDCLLPEGNGFYSILLRDSVQAKEDELTAKIAGYQKEMDELNDYITRWVHEIKIPVSVCDLILENGELEKGDTVRNFKIELERTKFLINQVLYAGRAAYYNEDLAVTEFSLAKTVREAVRSNSQFFIAKNIEVTLDYVDYNVTNDEKWVSYILGQILNNASKYTRQDGKVEIYAKDDGKSTQLHIRDNGIGIEPQDIKRIFDRGFTGQNGRKTTKSTGMGMYYSKKMADKLGIGLEVYSNINEYTEFVVVFYKIRDYFKVT